MTIRNPTTQTQRLDALLTHLDSSYITLVEFGCFVALSPDGEAIFWCPMNSDGTPERDDDNDHLNWGEVTAPEPEFLNEVNTAFGTEFHCDEFAGR